MNNDEKRVQYKDFSAWQNVHDIKEQEAYWKNEFATEIPRLDIKADYIRPQMQSFRGADVVIKTTEQISTEVSKLARKHGATEFMVTLAVFMLMLEKYSQKDDIVVGTAVSGRVHADTKGMLGMFVNTLAIKCNVDPNETFENLLSAVKEKCLQAFDNQEYQFEDLVEAVEKKRDFSRNPIFDVMFVLKEKENSLKAKGLLGGKSALVKRNVSKFDFTLMVTCMADGYEIDIEYCTDLFKEETMKYMAKHYVTLLENAVLHPDTRLQDLPMIDAQEEELVLMEFNATEKAFPQDKTVVDLFEEQAAKYPDHIALKFEDKIMTYAQLDARANQLARTLREHGVLPDDRVALIPARSMEMIVGIIGIIKAGGCYVPINPEYPEQRIGYILKDSDPKIVLTYQAKVPKGLNLLVLDLDDENSYAKTAEALPHVNCPGDLVYCIYTSGTTGNPKGVLIEHRNAVNMWVTYQGTFALTKEDTVLQFASVAFDQAVGDIFPTLCNGAALCLVPANMTYDMEQLQHYMNANHVTCVSLTPKVIEGLDVRKLPTLRLLESGGEAGNLNCLREWAKYVKVINTYGPTEATVNATSFTVKSDASMISIGHPIANTKVYLLNGMELCGIGVPGELCIAGEGLARGYLNREDLTARKFIKNPFAQGRLYRTGDLARWLPDGNIEYLGRIDEQVKIRGYRIELGEIESVLRRQEEVADVAVVVRYVGGDECLCAYIVGKQGRKLDLTKVREAIRKDLTEYMIPAFMTQIDALPLTLNGKLNKQALPQPDIVEGWKHTAPTTETEKVIVEVFEEILGVSPIGIEDSFFELGGHSLRATTAMNAIEKRTGIRLPLKEIFTSPTPSMLAKKLDTMGTGHYCAIPKAKPQEMYHVSSAQKRLFVLDQIEGGSTTYNMPEALEASSALDLMKVQTAVDELIKRHESLRTSFVLKDGQAYQIIADDVSYKIEYEEKDEFDQEEMKRFLCPFNLAKAPLFRLKVIKCRKADNYILLFDMHHIISDHKTINLLMEDFTRLYRGEVLQPLRVQYKDYSEWMGTRDLTGQREYWKKVFADEIPVLDLGTDYTRPKTQSFCGAHVYAALSKDQKQRIEKLNLENQTTDYMLLMAVFMVELHQYSRQEDIVVGTPITGRVHEDTETIAGMFVNTIAMRGYPKAEKTFLEFLSEIKESALLAYENQEYPFEELVEDVKVSRDLSRNPIFDVMLAIQNNEKTELAMGETTLKPIQVDSGVTKFDLDLEIMEDDGGYTLDLAYCTDLFTQRTAQAILEHFTTLIDSVIGNPQAKLSELEMLPATERNRIIQVFNNTYAEYPKNWSVINQFELQVERLPEKTAIEYESGSLTYRELNRKVNALAIKLWQLGVRPDDTVVVMTSPKAETIIGILAVLKCGGAYIPIDQEYPDERIRNILEDAVPKAILATDIQYETNIPVLKLNIERMEDEDNNPEPVANTENLAYVIYTSGTTGRPKGVAITRGNLNSYLTYASKTYQKGACVTMLVTNLCFDLSVTSLYLPFITGGCLILKEGNIVNKLSAALTDSRITFLKLTPTHLRMVEGCNQTVNLPALESLIVGGEELTTDVALQTQHLLGKHVKIHNEYGPTEATVGCCDYIYNEKTDTKQSVGIGAPISNVQIYILNGNQLCGIGIAGELCIAGDGVAKGYYNRASLTSLKFIQNPVGEGRLYRSGDLARWLPDGNLEYLGRIDEQIKVRGFRIEPGEIESVLRRQPGISDAAVIALEVNEDKSLCAYLIASEETTTLNYQKIKEALRKELPEYMVPAYMMQIEVFPLNRSGKLDKMSLPKPDMSAKLEYVAARTLVEQAIVEVFTEILGVPHIGIDDSFFEFGGDSIKAIRVVTKLRERGYELSVAELMSLKTARLIGQSIHSTGVARTYEQGEVNGESELLPIQREFFHKKYPVPGHYNQAMLLQSDELFELDCLKQAIAEVIRHHDALRNVYDGQRQITLPVEESKLYDWYEYTIDRKENIARQIESISEVIQESMDLDNGPLVKIGLFHTELGDYLLICIHHLVVDGVSWRILLEDLWNGYRQAQKTGSIMLPKKTASYKQWATTLANYAESEQVIKDLDYWEKAARKSKDTNAFQNNSKESGISEVQTIEADRVKTSQLLFEAEKTYGTNINDLLLAALIIAVNRWNQSQSITVEVEGHGREEIDTPIDIDRTVGWFTSIYDVVLELGTTVENTIVEVKEALRRIPNHGLSYGVLKYLANREDLDMAAEITFNYLGALDQELDKFEGISMSSLSIGKSRADQNVESTGLSFNGVIMDGQLRFELTYDTGLYAQEEAKGLCRAYEQAITDVIDTCLSKKEIVRTPSDYGIYDMSCTEWKELTMSGEIDKVYKMTPLQEGMLFHKLIDTNATSYVTQTVFLINSGLHMDNVRKSLELLSNKYEVLKTKILADRVNGPLQIIMRDRCIELNEIIVNSQEEIEERKQADIKRGFDLSNDSLLRLTVLCKGEQCTLLWTKHHIIMDGWCTSLLFHDFINYYAQLCNGIELLKIKQQMEKEKQEILPYSEYINWLEKQNKSKALNYWKSLLSDYESAITIPPLDVNQHLDPVSKLEEYTVPMELFKRIEQLAGQLNVTVSTIVETAWGILLGKYNRCQDVVFGKVVSGRNANLPGIVNAVGLFINTIPSRVTTREGDTVAVLIQRMQAQAIQSMDYEYSSLTEVQSQSKVGNHLIQTLFVFENYYIAESAYDGLSGFDIKLESDREEINYDISISAYIQQTLHLDVMYNAGNYTAEEMNCLLSRMSGLLDDMTANPELKVSDLVMLTDEEKKKVVKDFNDSDLEYTREQTVISLFDAQVKCAPEKVAIEYGMNSLTFARVNKMANALAIQLRQSGIGPDDKVAIMTDLNAETIIGILGILKCGGAYIPIDPDTPVERITHILDDAAPKAILTANKDMMHKIPVIELSLAAMKEEEINPDPVVTNENIAYVIYTSGTTGKPKGVAVTYGNLNHYLFYACHTYLSSPCITALITSLSFDLSVTSLYLPLISGGCLLLKQGDMASRLMSTLQDSRITFLKLTPSHLKMLDCAEAVHLPELKTLIVGGEELTTDTAYKTQKLFGQGVQIHNEYGPTEATVGCCDYIYDAAKDTGISVGIGRPICNTQIYVLNGVKLCGIGIPGELCIAGDGVAKGYLNRPELTAVKFVKNPFGKGRMYRSGDLARWLSDGSLEYLGRIDEQVKIHGFRIELGEIESILRKLPSVSDAAVTVLEAKSDKSLCAYLVAADQTVPLDMDRIKETLRKELPEYMIPAYLLQIEALPLNHNGKLNRKELPVPDVSVNHNYVMPRNEAEEAVAKVYEDILEEASIGIDDDFFALGGNSIKAIRVISNLRQKGYELSVADLMRHKTVRLICENIQSVTAASLDLACTDDEIEKRQKIKDALECYGDNYKNAKYSSECSVLNGQTIFLRNDAQAITDMIRFNVNAQRVSMALKKVIEKQGVLRTRLNQKQCRLEEYSYSALWEIPVIKGELRLSAETCQDIANQIAFLSDGKLLSRFLICKIDENHCILMSAIHHLVWDGFSQDLLRTMLNETLRDGSIDSKEFSYINYCELVDQQVESIKVTKELESRAERYGETAKAQAKKVVNRDPKRVTKLEVKLNAQQLERFSEYPNETAMEFLSGLMYPNQLIDSVNVSFAVLEHNRNDFNKGLLGQSLNLSFACYEVSTKQKEPFLLILDDMDIDQRAITEELLILSQKYGVKDMINLIPVINYQGILSKYANEAVKLTKDLSIEAMTLDSEDLGVGMHFYIQNDILCARISGIKIEKELVEKVMMKL